MQHHMIKVARHLLISGFIRVNTPILPHLVCVVLVRCSREEAIQTRMLN